MALGDQKSVAKALIKLNLHTASAGAMAAATGVDATVLESIAKKLPAGTDLTEEETDAYGRFDLLITAVLDQVGRYGPNPFTADCPLFKNSTDHAAPGTRVACLH
jgi:hypothetical protein